VRFTLTIPCLLLTFALVQGCVTQNQAAKVAEQAAADSKDDAACREKSGTDKAAYEACRSRLTEARDQQDSAQEQRRRDFDRVLGAGTRIDANN
jgi:hypothetical protein